jgi:hypothetical protein
LVSFENISYLGQDYQDALCVMATGGAHATRTLYTNKEEVIIELRKPIVMNGITAIITAADLQDRSIHIELPPVKKRLQSKEVEESFSKNHAKFVGALLDQVVLALKLLPTVRIPDADKPRMVDFAHLGEAVFQANGHASGSFVECYLTMRQKGVHRTIEGSPVGMALLTYLDRNPNGWRGKLIDLLAHLASFKPAGESNWPKSGKGLGDALRRLTPPLRMLGYDCISNQKTSGSIIWEITPHKVTNQCPASPTSPTELLNMDVPLLGHEGHENYSYEELDDIESDLP